MQRRHRCQAHERPSGKKSRTAAQVVRGCAQYDPAVDIDWSAARRAGQVTTAEHRVSLYGTELWQRITRSSATSSGKHEIISIHSFGIYSESH